MSTHNSVRVWEKFFFFFFITVQLVGSQFPNQGLNLGHSSESTKS